MFQVKFSAAVAGAALIMASGLGPGSPLSAAEPAGLEGAWSGGGKVNFPSGETESARCRANFRKQGGNSYSMSATCATPSLRVQQTAVLRQTGPGHFAGEFHNAEYNINGSIRITVSGRSLSASLNGGGGSAHFSLSR